MNIFTLSPQQLRFFEVFGYLVLPRLLKDDIEEITDAFEQVWAERGMDHDGTKRSMIVPFIDQHERLCALLDDDRIEGLVGCLIGAGFQYVGSDGNFYEGDTPWHSDRLATEVRFLKVAFYLDAVRRHSGCLRVIPGSHLAEDTFAGTLTDNLGEPEGIYDLDGSEIPAVALESAPGDVVIFNHRLKHAAFGGGERRRMFTINCCERIKRPSRLRCCAPASPITSNTASTACTVRRCWPPPAPSA